MAITLPVMFTSIEDAEVSFNRPVSDETVRKILQNINMLGELAKLGQLIPVAVNQPGVPSPNPDIFQQANGSEIVQIDSPLQSTIGSEKFTPDMTKHFLRGAPDESTNGYTAADQINVMEHTHAVDVVCPPLIIGESGDERKSYAICHTHAIEDDLNPAEPIDPKHVKVVFYLKIN